MSKLLVLVFCLFGATGFAAAIPNSELTPGALCTPNDPNFEGYAYPERIARCIRNIGIDEKIKVAALYGNIPQQQWKNYEFDHLIPLCAGGSNDIQNLWPQPITEAHEKDHLEDAVCKAMSAGKMTQAQAVQKIWAFFKQLYELE